MDRKEEQEEHEPRKNRSGRSRHALGRMEGERKRDGEKGKGKAMWEGVEGKESLTYQGEKERAGNGLGGCR